ncbi:ORF6N domain-containing protein [Lysinibacillus fusiformis]|uniref:ORF6N domain-containing protein n=1 Tax=Lysinibacillus fusiformis TaxID=28031 RepID=UPI001EF52FD1|nr:ORF6N domain-containing protein [Lysinibacillus fusiformis]MCG7435537.1 ORF6N domain-containing protein [Lysinibacillus fusiformis]
MLPEIIVHDSVRVLTSAQLAESFKTDSKTINRNFQRNQGQFELGVHYFALTGEDLKAFKGARQNDATLKYVSVLYLWTEKGAFLHAQFSKSKQAKDAYRALIDSYYTMLDKPPMEQSQTLAISLADYQQLESRVTTLEQRLQDVTLHSGEQLRLRKEVNQRVYELAGGEKDARRALFRAIWSAIKERYHVGSYRDVKQQELQDALRFVAKWGGEAS